MQAKAALNKVSCWKSKLWPDTLQSTVAGPPKSLAWESGKFQARFVHVQDLNVGNNSVLQNGCGQLSLKRTKWNAYKNCGHMFLVCDVICIDARICWHNFEDVWFSSFLWGTTWRKHCFSCRWMCQVFAVFFFSSSRACFSGLGLSGVGWDVDVHSHLLHELDATSRMENKGPGAPTTIRNVVLFSSCVWWQHCMFESASSFETGMSKRWNKKSVKIVQANQSFQPCF